MTDRVYAMTRVGPGDYLLPSNDGKTLWRIHRYLDRDEGRDVMIWAASFYAGPGWGTLSGSLPDDYLDWHRGYMGLQSYWREWGTWFRTRAEAIDYALAANPTAA